MIPARSEVACFSDLKSQCKDFELHHTGTHVHNPGKNDGDDHNSIGIWVIPDNLLTTIKPTLRQQAQRACQLD